MVKGFAPVHFRDADQVIRWQHLSLHSPSVRPCSSQTARRKRIAEPKVFILETEHRANHRLFSISKITHRSVEKTYTTVLFFQTTRRRKKVANTKKKVPFAETIPGKLSFLFRKSDTGVSKKLLQCCVAEKMANKEIFLLDTQTL
jgi:hypothetical protein